MKRLMIGLSGLWLMLSLVIGGVAVVSRTEGERDVVMLACWLADPVGDYRCVPDEMMTPDEVRAASSLVLTWNALSSLPPEIGQLHYLQYLVLSGNPLESPPPEIVEQGTEAVLAYLRE